MEYLKSVKINFDLQESFIDDFFMQRTIADSNWAPLDRVLTGSHFPRLRQFDIVIKVAAMLHHRSDFDEKDFKNATKGCFESSFSRMMVSETIIFDLQVWVRRSLLEGGSGSKEIEWEPRMMKQ